MCSNDLFCLKLPCRVPHINEKGVHYILKLAMMSPCCTTPSGSLLQYSPTADMPLAKSMNSNYIERN
jgi:hypothetical protein